MKENKKFWIEYDYDFSIYLIIQIAGGVFLSFSSPLPLALFLSIYLSIYLNNGRYPQKRNHKMGNNNNNNITNWLKTHTYQTAHT